MKQNIILACFIAVICSSLVDSVVISTIKKARCVIPKDISSVSRAVLLQQCISANGAQGNETQCYEELGCFPMTSPWTSLLRPFPTPASPAEIDVRLYLYTFGNRMRFNVPLWPTISLAGSDFSPKRKKNVFITHGFASNGNASWLDDMKNAYLLQREANVFLVDWGKGAANANYLKVASNTRIVGAELARFGKYLINMMGVGPDTLHLIGHSLGAHISAYMAKGIAELGKGKVGRLTALDPAQPGFEREAKIVRLDPDDATFVDVIHSDAKPFIPLLGFGMLSPIGHVDLYLNTGTNQPGCFTNLSHHVANIKSIGDLKLLPVETLSQIVSCNHGRSYDVFTESLKSPVTCLWGRKISRIVNVAKVSTQGALQILDPLVRDISACTPDTCTQPGHATPTLKARGIFTVTTTNRAPFCVADLKRDQSLFGRLTSGVWSIGTSLTDKITNTASNIYTGVSNLFG